MFLSIFSLCLSIVLFSFRHGEWHKELVLSLAAISNFSMSPFILGPHDETRGDWCIGVSAVISFSFVLLPVLAYIPLRECLLFRFILSLPYVKRYLFFGRVNSIFFKQALCISLFVSAFFLGYGTLKRTWQ